MLSLQGSQVLPFSPQIMVGYSAGDFGGGSNLVNSPTPPVGANPNSPKFGDFAARSDVDAIAFWSLQNLGLGNWSMIQAARAGVRASDMQRLTVFNEVRAEVATAFARKRTQLALIGVRQRRRRVESVGVSARPQRAGSGRPAHRSARQPALLDRARDGLPQCDC